MNRLRADADALGKLSHRNLPGGEVVPEPHGDMVTVMVRAVKPDNSPAWLWRESAQTAQCGMPNRIRELRLARGLTLEELADAAGTSVQQISRLELGYRRLTDDWMRRLAPVLSCRPAELMSDSGPDLNCVVENVQEIKLIRFWRLLSIEEKRMIAAFARDKGLEILNNDPRKMSA